MSVVPPIIGGVGLCRAGCRPLTVEAGGRHEARLRSSHGERGFALIVTLWVIAVLTAVALGFADVVRMDRRRCANTVSGVQSEQAIAAATRYIQVLLISDDWSETLPDEDSARLEAVPVGDSLFWVLGRAVDDVEPDEPVFGLVDEASKLNLNTATTDMLLGLPGMTAEFAAAIVDWRDDDEEPSEGGAESETYLRLDRTYACKNADFESIEELRLVYGASTDILYGRDRNLNGLMDAWEDDESVDVLREGSLPTTPYGVLEYVTVWSCESGEQADGSAKLNINERDSSEVSKLLEEALGAEIAGRVATSTGLGRTQYGSLLEFYLASGLTAEEFAEIDDALTVNKDAATPGLVNVNTASSVVLACLPGIDDEAAAKLVAYRVLNSESLNSVAWVAEALEREDALEVGPFLTTSISRVSTDLVAVGGGGRGLRRAFLVWDVSGTEATVLYRRDRTAHGWCLGQDVREELSL